jgi:aspartate/glutamate racemase
MSSTVESLKRRAEKLAEKAGGDIILIFTNHPEQVADRIKAIWEYGNIPLILPEEDRDL